jgi:hypothetical protein
MLRMATAVIWLQLRLLLNKKDVLDDIGEKAYFCPIFVVAG